MTEGNTYWSQRGREYRLGPPVEGAGDSVYSVPLAREVVAMIYRDGSDPAVRERKIEAMLKRPPDLPPIVEDGERFVRMAWPVATLHDKSRKFVGFLMPAVDMQATSPLKLVLDDLRARAEGLPTSLGAKINLAARLAVAITELHQQEHRVVHLSPANLRFYRQSLQLALIGCERFSINGNRERFAAELGPAGIAFDYLAPEYQDQPITPGSEELQDRFALAVLVFQLLNFGIHPFSGIPTGDDVPDDIPGCIARKCYAYGATLHPGLAPIPGSGHLAMPKELRSLFDRAFAGNADARPPALEWSTWLQFYSIPTNNCVVKCDANPRHHHFAGLPCAACARSPSQPKKQSEPVAAPRENPFLSADTNEPPFVRAEHAFPAANQFPPAKLPEPTVQRWAILQRRTPFEKVGLLALLIFAVGYGIVSILSPTTHSRSTAGDVVQKPEDIPTPPARDPYLAGNPALQQSEAQTNGYVTAAALAIANNDRIAWQDAMTNLHTDVPAHAPAPPSEFHAAFDEFSSGLSPDHFDTGKLRGLIKQLGKVLKDNPFDDQTAYELGWLSLASGQRDEARMFFLHAIWVNPDRANAWYGLAVVGADDKQKTGALATAELLTTDHAQAEAMQKAFPPLMLRVCSVVPDHFAALLTIARLVADRNRPFVASPKYE